MKEVAAPSGGPWGGKKVDANFVALLKQHFGVETMDHLMNEKPQAWLKLMTTFEAAKKTLKSTGNAPLRIDLGFPFCMEISRKLRKEIDDLLQDVDGVSFRDGYLVIDHNVACGLFSDSVTEIVNQAHSVLRDKTAVELCLTGGRFWYV